MQYYLITCSSLTYAQKAVRALERAGIKAGVAKLPQALSDDGCGYSVKVEEHRLPEALASIKRAGINPKKVFVRNPDGTYKEVQMQ